MQGINGVPVMNKDEIARGGGHKLEKGGNTGFSRLERQVLNTKSQF